MQQQDTHTTSRARLSLRRLALLAAVALPSVLVSLLLLALAYLPPTFGFEPDGTDTLYRDALTVVALLTLTGAGTAWRFPRVSAIGFVVLALPFAYFGALGIGVTSALLIAAGASAGLYLASAPTG